MSYTYYHASIGTSRSGESSSEHSYFNMSLGPYRTDAEQMAVNEYWHLVQFLAWPEGPDWFGVVDGETQWIPGTIYNNNRFVRYRMWDGTKWQTS
jgi:hypothetical protein